MPVDTSCGIRGAQGAPSTDRPTQLSTIRFCQINMNGCKAATSSLVDFVLRRQIDIILFQDAYRRGGALVGFPSSWSTFLSNGRGAGIAVTDPSLNVNVVHCGEYSVGLNIQLSTGGLTISSVYSPPSADLGAALSGLGEVIGLPKVLVAGDLNAKSRVGWLVLILLAQDPHGICCAKQLVIKAHKLNASKGGKLFFECKIF